jgi:hypothetical protein
VVIHVFIAVLQLRQIGVSSISALRIAQAHHENELCEDQFRIRMALLLCAARTTGAVAKIR